MPALARRAGAATAAAPRRKSTSAIRSLFSRPFNAAATAALPDLRRSKSFSCGRGGDALAAAVAGAGGGYEPQRRSFPASSSAAAAALAAEVLPPELGAGGGGARARGRRRVRGGGERGKWGGTHR